jgi:hypothetical protein
MLTAKHHQNLFESKIPTDFVLPDWNSPQYYARKLKASDCYQDYTSVLESIDIIKETRGGDWNVDNMNLEENLIDLAYHQRQSEYNQAFVYAIFTPDKNEYIGCFYIYPIGFRAEITELTKNYDADISFWISKKFYTKDFYFQFWSDLQMFLKKNYPFFKFYFSNKLKS